LIPSGVAHFLNFLFFTERSSPVLLTEKQRHMGWGR